LAYKDPNAHAVWEREVAIWSSVSARLSALEGGKVSVPTSPPGGGVSGGTSGSGGGFTGILAIPQGGTGLGTLGTASQLLGVNSSGSGLEYKTVAGTAHQVAVTPSSGAITFSLPQAIDVTSSVVFSALQLSGLTASELVGTDASKNLISVPYSTVTGSTAMGGDVSGTTSAATVVGLQGVSLPAPSGSGHALVYTGSALSWSAIVNSLSAGTGISVSGSSGSVTVSNTGVTSVGLSLPGLFSVAGSPVTGTGTLSASLLSQSANTVFAGPASGSAATPGFRSLAAADLAASLSLSITGLTLSGLTASQPVVSNGSKALASQSYGSFLSSLGIATASGSGEFLYDSGSGSYSLSGLLQYNQANGLLYAQPTSTTQPILGVQLPSGSSNPLLYAADGGGNNICFIEWVSGSGFLKVLSSSAASGSNSRSALQIGSFNYPSINQAAIAGYTCVTQGGSPSGGGVLGSIQFENAQSGAQTSSAAGTDLVFSLVPIGSPPNSISQYLKLSANGNLVCMGGPSTGSSDGFLYIPVVGGTPTGSPTAYSGTAAICLEQSGSLYKLWAYLNGGWHWVALV
jgi:hypothetical protein